MENQPTIEELKARTTNVFEGILESRKFDDDSAQQIPEILSAWENCNDNSPRWQSADRISLVSFLDYLIYVKEVRNRSSNSNSYGVNIREWIIEFFKQGGFYPERLRKLIFDEEQRFTQIAKYARSLNPDFTTTFYDGIEQMAYCVSNNNDKDSDFYVTCEKYDGKDVAIAISYEEMGERYSDKKIQDITNSVPRIIWSSGNRSKSVQYFTALKGKPLCWELRQDNSGTTWNSASPRNTF